MNPEPTPQSRFDLDEEFGKSIAALNDVYASSVKGGDLRTALVARKELNRLLGLYTISQTVKQNQAEIQSLTQTLFDIYDLLEVTNENEAIEMIELLKENRS